MSEIYGDVYFIINFTMDFICLYLTSLITKRKIKIKRLSAASLLGGLYSLALLALSPVESVGILLSAALGVVMTLIAFGRKRLPGNSLVFTGVSLFMGGAMTFILSHIRRFVPEDYAVYSPLFIVCALLCAVFSLVCERFSHSLSSKKKCTVTIVLSGIGQKLEGLVDSGNTLCDPISGYPVIIICKSAAGRYIKNGIAGTDVLMSMAKAGMKIRMISASGINKEPSCLAAFVPDDVKIDGIAMRCIVAFSDKESFGGMDALVPTTLVREGRTRKKSARQSDLPHGK